MFGLTGGLPGSMRFVPGAIWSMTAVSSGCSFGRRGAQLHVLRHRLRMPFTVASVSPTSAGRIVGHEDRRAFDPWLAGLEVEHASRRTHHDVRPGLELVDLPVERGAADDSSALTAEPGELREVGTGGGSWARARAWREHDQFAMPPGRRRGA